MQAQHVSRAASKASGARAACVRARTAASACMCVCAWRAGVLHSSRLPPCTSVTPPPCRLHVAHARTAKVLASVKAQQLARHGHQAGVRHRSHGDTAAAGRRQLAADTAAAVRGGIGQQASGTMRCLINNTAGEAVRGHACSRGDRSMRERARGDGGINSRAADACAHLPGRLRRWNSSSADAEAMAQAQSSASAAAASSRPRWLWLRDDMAAS